MHVRECIAFSRLNSLFSQVDIQDMVKHCVQVLKPTSTERIKTLLGTLLGQHAPAPAPLDTFEVGSLDDNHIKRSVSTDSATEDWVRSESAVGTDSAVGAHVAGTVSDTNSTEMSVETKEGLESALFPNDIFASSDPNSDSEVTMPDDSDTSLKSMHSLNDNLPLTAQLDQQLATLPTMVQFRHVYVRLCHILQQPAAQDICTEIDQFVSAMENTYERINEATNGLVFDAEPGAPSRDASRSPSLDPIRSNQTPPIAVVPGKLKKRRSSSSVTSSSAPSSFQACTASVSTQRKSLFFKFVLL